jgi:hypothetical protein
MPDREWVDDGSVPDDAILWRGIVPDLIETDPITGRVIPREGAFRGPSEVSMNVAAETSVAAMQARNATWRLWCLRARQIRSFGCIVVRDAEEGDTSHVLVIRANKLGSRLTGGMANSMRRKGWWNGDAPSSEG